MTVPGLFVLGATHQTAPLEVREKLALGAEAAAAFRAELASLADLREFAVLNTCNRVECYGVAAEPSAPSKVQDAFCARKGFEPADFDKFRLRLEGRAAVQHLLEVASGLDSQMLGETEIFGQVKDAYAAACQARSAGPVLNRLFQKAFQAAKHVRTHTAVTSGPVSVASVAVEIALGVYGRLDGARVLLLGAGDIGEKVAHAFARRGASAITVVSRRPERAATLARTFSAATIPFEDRESHLMDFDVVACATASPAAILSAAAVSAAMKRRPARPLLMIDLALPRNIEPAAAAFDNVFLYNLDDLARAAEENRAARESEAAKGRSILAGKAQALWSQLEPMLSPAASQAPAQPSPPAAALGRPERGPTR